MLNIDDVDTLWIELCGSNCSCATLYEYRLCDYFPCLNLLCAVMVASGVDMVAYSLQRLPKSSQCLLMRTVP
jgi:hypothetical protein